jgi:hypothetical protein
LLVVGVAAVAAVELVESGVVAKVLQLGGHLASVARVDAVVAQCGPQ